MPLPGRIKRKIDKIILESEKEKSGVSMAWLLSEIRYNNSGEVKRYLKRASWSKMEVHKLAFFWYHMDEEESAVSKRHSFLRKGSQRDIWIPPSVQKELSKKRRTRGPK